MKSPQRPLFNIHCFIHYINQFNRSIRYFSMHCWGRGPQFNIRSTAREWRTYTETSPNKPALW